MINKVNDVRLPSKSDKDVFLANLLKNADFKTGFYQFPAIKNCPIGKPKGTVLWSKRHLCQDKASNALIFYEYDGNFDDKDGIYNILKYGTDAEIEALIDELKQYAFVICPDYSVYGNFPVYKQIDAMARSREVGFILQDRGVKVIVNYRATHEWSYEAALSGLSIGQTVAIGSLGALRDGESRKLLKESIIALAECVCPKVVIVYGYAPDDVFGPLKDRGADIWRFDSEIAKAFGAGEVTDMGMKSKSAHFPSGGQGGSGARVSGSGGSGSGGGKRPSYPKNDGQVKHMFRGGRGHLPDTPANRNTIATVASDEHNYVGADKHGNRWYAKTTGGKQYWVQVRNGVIRNCGCNEPPRPDDQLFDRKDKK